MYEDQSSPSKALSLKTRGKGERARARENTGENWMRFYNKEGEEEEENELALSSHLNSSRGARDARVSPSSSSSTSSSHPTRSSSSGSGSVVGFPLRHQLWRLDDGGHLVDGGERRRAELRREAGDAGCGGGLRVQRMDVAVCF